MKYCPNTDCPHFHRTHKCAEYEDDVLVCFDCQTELIRYDSTQKPDASAVHPDSNLTLLIKILDPTEAEMIKLKLIDNGVNAILFDSNVGYTYGGAITFAFGGIRIMVPEEQLEAARQIFAIYMKNKSGESGLDFDDYDLGLHCPACLKTGLALREYRTRLWTLFTALFMGVGLMDSGKAARKRYYCASCDKYWKNSELDDPLPEK